MPAGDGPGRAETGSSPDGERSGQNRPSRHAKRRPELRPCRSIRRFISGRLVDDVARPVPAPDADQRDEDGRAHARIVDLDAGGGDGHRVTTGLGGDRRTRHRACRLPGRDGAGDGARHPDPGADGEELSGHRSRRRHRRRRGVGRAVRIVERVVVERVVVGRVDKQSRRDAGQYRQVAGRRRYHRSPGSGATDRDP